MIEMKTDLKWRAIGVGQLEASIPGYKPQSVKYGYRVVLGNDGNWKAFYEGNMIKSGSLQACLEACDDNER